MFSYIFTDGVELCKYFFRFPLGVAKPMLSKLLQSLKKKAGNLLGKFVISLPKLERMKQVQ